MMRTLRMAPALLDVVRAGALRAYPNECCGLVEGVATAEGWRAHGVHPSRNLAADRAHAFLVDPEIHFRLLRSLRGGESAVIGCYHSHPDGAPRPSDRDRDEAADHDFLWLVAAATRTDAHIAAYVFDAGERVFRDVAIR